MDEEKGFTGETFRALKHMWRMGLRPFYTAAKHATFRGVPPKPKGNLPEEVYLRALKWSAILWAVLPTSLLVLNELFFDWRWFTGWFGLIVFLLLLWISYIGTPLGVSLDVLLPNTKTIGERYLKFIRAALFGELVLAMILWVLPFRSGRNILPMFIIAALATWFGYSILGDVTKVLARFGTKLGLALMLLFVFALFLPNRSEQVVCWARSLDGVEPEGECKERKVAKPEKVRIVIAATPAPAPEPEESVESQQASTDGPTRKIRIRLAAFEKSRVYRPAEEIGRSATWQTSTPTANVNITYVGKDKDGNEVWKDNFTDGPGNRVVFPFTPPETVVYHEVSFEAFSAPAEVDLLIFQSDSM